MKKQISILILFCLSLFVACEETVTMDGSVGARVDAVMKGYTEDLAGAQNGWIAEIPTKEGVYHFHMTFTLDNKVTMYTDNLYYPKLNGVPKQSTYNFRSLQRPTLSFDTYSYLAIINDPDNAISNGSGNMGLETDFEFEVDHVADRVYYLTGRINRVAATLRPATAEEAAAVRNGGLMNVLNNAINYKEGKFCYFTSGETHIGVKLNSRSADFSYVNAAGAVAQATVNTRTQLNNNIELLEPLKLENGKTVTGFTWDTATNTFTTIFTDGTAIVQAQEMPVIPLYLMLGPGKNYTELASLQSMYPSADPAVNYFAALYGQAYKALMTRYNMQLGQIDFDFYTTESGSPRMSMRTLVGRYSGWVTFLIEFNETQTEFTIKGMNFDDDAYGNGKPFYQNGVNLIADWMIGKTFKIEWSPIIFGSYSIGQFVLVGGDVPAEIYGALF